MWPENVWLKGYLWGQGWHKGANVWKITKVLLAFRPQEKYSPGKPLHNMLHKFIGYLSGLKKIIPGHREFRNELVLSNHVCMFTLTKFFSN